MWEGAGLEGVEVRTVDGFQGREKELIILRQVPYRTVLLTMPVIDILRNFLFIPRIS